MRRLGCVVLLAGVLGGIAGCGEARPGAGASRDAGSADSGAVTCQSGALVLAGPSTGTPHGIFLMSNASLSGSAFSATLPAGGSIVLEWNGDATRGTVTVMGQMAIPSEDAETASSFCVLAPSSLAIHGRTGVMQLELEPGSPPACGAGGTIDAGMPSTACFELAS